MLPASQDRAYQDFITLLTKFTEIVSKPEAEIELVLIKSQFQQLSNWFTEHIQQLNYQDFAPGITYRWQAIQTEILREFKLLSTDLLFLIAARQHSTQRQRLQTINSRLTKLIAYCQVILQANH